LMLANLGERTTKTRKIDIFAWHLLVAKQH